MYFLNIIHSTYFLNLLTLTETITYISPLFTAIALVSPQFIFIFQFVIIALMIIKFSPHPHLYQTLAIGHLLATTLSSM